MLLFINIINRECQDWKKEEEKEEEKTMKTKQSK